MRVKPILKGIFAASLLYAAAGPASAQNARLPYHQLYSIEKAQTQWNRSHTNLFVVMILQSTLPGVKASDLAVYIETKAGKIPVEIGAAGDFTIPMRDDLLAEDPWLITNQPKGTLRLNSKGGLVLGHIANSEHYARLMGPVRDYAEAQEQMRRFFPGSPGLRVTGLRLTFAAAQKSASAVIHAKGGNRKLEANDQGEIILPLVEELLEENPEISLTEIPGAVEIVAHNK